MVKRKKGNRIHGRTGPYYSLGVVKGLVKTGNILIREKALDSALKDFGWESPDILDALKKIADQTLLQKRRVSFYSKNAC